MEDIKLVKINSKNWERICSLDPGKEGAEFIVPNAFSIAQSAYEEGWTVKGIAQDTLLIGFVMYGYSQELFRHELCRFMIDCQYQGKGYGKQALSLIVNKMFRQFRCEEIYARTSPKNSKAKHLYEQAGFTLTERIYGKGGIEEVYSCTGPFIGKESSLPPTKKNEILKSFIERYNKVE